MPAKELQKVQKITAEALQLSPEAREMIIEQIFQFSPEVRKIIIERFLQYLNQTSADQDEEKIWETIAKINEGKKVKKRLKNEEIDEVLYA